MSINPTGNNKITVYQGDTNKSFDTVVEKIENTHSLKDSFYKELKKNIKEDIYLIKSEFFPEISIDDIKSITYEIAGQETHYSGKVPLFLKITFNNKTEVNIVYKPRSLFPDKLLEKALASFIKRPERPICDVKDHGYDLLIEGKTLGDKENLSSFINTHDANIKLIFILNEMGFEDTHNENFILDKNQILHFIDAEVHNTGTSVDTSELIKKLKETNFSNEERTSLSGYKEELIKHDTRLLLSNTGAYTGSTEIPRKYKIPKSSGGQCKVRVLDKEEKTELCNKERSIKIDQIIGLAKFLCMNKFIEINEKSIMLDDLKEKIELAFVTPGPLSAIEDELSCSKMIPKEVPAFRFNFNENCIKLPLTRERLTLKNLE